MHARSEAHGGVGRRTFLYGLGAAAGASALGAGSTPVRAAASNASTASTARSASSVSGVSAEPSMADWLADVGNYDGVVNKTGLDEVVVAVGTDANGGAFGFGPAAVRVDPGTTVVWEWTGEGGSHDVVATDDSFASSLLGDAGERFEHTFDDEGTTLYSCTPHEAMGMKGAVVVGDAPDGLESSGAEPDYGDWFDDVDNYDATVDATGSEEVRIAVGAEGNDGNFAFDPPAVHVDPGTTVVWEWTGDGGTHDVAATDGEFASELSATAGHEYALTFDGDGISTYSCTPHETMGMKGAVVVGEPVTAGIYVGWEALGVAGAVVAAALSPLALLAFLIARGDGDEPPTNPGMDRPRGDRRRGERTHGDRPRRGPPRSGA